MKPKDLDADPYGNQDLTQTAAGLDHQPQPPGASANTGTTNYYFVNVTAQPWEQPRPERSASEDYHR